MTGVPFGSLANANAMPGWQIRWAAVRCEAATRTAGVENVRRGARTPPARLIDGGTMARSVAPNADDSMTGFALFFTHGARVMWWKAQMDGD